MEDNDFRTTHAVLHRLGALEWQEVERRTLAVAGTYRGLIAMGMVFWNRDAAQRVSWSSDHKYCISDYELAKMER